jgi:hypothetical protein
LAQTLEKIPGMAKRIPKPPPPSPPKDNKDSTISKIGRPLAYAFIAAVLAITGWVIAKPDPVLNVSVSPDTVGIENGGYHAVKYRFHEVNGVAVTVDSQDTKWLLPDGTVIESSSNNRILGGSFTVSGRSQHELNDNVYLSPGLVRQLEMAGASNVKLETIFSAKSTNERRVKAKTVLNIIPIKNLKPTMPHVAFDGRQGHIVVRNNSLYSLKVTLWHPDSKIVLKSWTIAGEAEMYLKKDNEDLVFGNDWGIQLGEADIKSIQDSSHWINTEKKWEVNQDTFFK